MPGTRRAAIAANASGTRTSTERRPRSVTWIRIRRPRPLPDIVPELARGSVGRAGPWRPRASMIGAASSALSLPSLTSRRTVASSSPMSAAPRQAASRLVNVDLAALECTQHLELHGLVGCRWHRHRRLALLEGHDAPRAAHVHVAGHRVEDEPWYAALDDQATTSDLPLDHGVQARPH